MLNALSGERGYDLPLILGVMFISATAIIALNATADVVARMIDPRISSVSRSGAGGVRSGLGVTQLRQHLRAEQLDAAALVDPVRRAELDAVDARVEERLRLRDDPRGLAREREAVEHVVGDLVRRHVGSTSVVGSTAADDRQVERDLPRARARARARRPRRRR